MESANHEPRLDRQSSINNSRMGHCEQVERKPDILHPRINKMCRYFRFRLFYFRQRIMVPYTAAIDREIRFILKAAPRGMTLDIQFFYHIGWVYYQFPVWCKRHCKALCKAFIKSRPHRLAHFASSFDPRDDANTWCCKRCSADIRIKYFMLIKTGRLILLMVLIIIEKCF
jgi:hypothetical protein